MLQRLPMEPAVCRAVSWACSSQALAALREDKTSSPTLVHCLETLGSPSQVALSFCLHPPALQLLLRLHLWEELLTIQIEVLEVTFSCVPGRLPHVTAHLSFPFCLSWWLMWARRFPMGSPMSFYRVGKKPGSESGKAAGAGLSSSGSGVRFYKRPERNWGPETESSAAQDKTDTHLSSLCLSIGANFAFQTWACPHTSRLSWQADSPWATAAAPVTPASATPRIQVPFLL